MDLSEKYKTEYSSIKDSRLADRLASKKTRYNQRVYIEGFITGIAVCIILIIEMPFILLGVGIYLSFLESLFYF